MRRRLVTTFSCGLSYRLLDGVGTDTRVSPRLCALSTVTSTSTRATLRWIA